MPDPKKKGQQSAAKQNVIEALKDLGSSSVSGIQDLFKDTSDDFFSELIGVKPAQKKVGGELQKGESLDMNEALKGKTEENKKLKAQISLERQLSQEESRRSQERTNELRVQLQALMTEVAKLAKTTSGLAQEVKIATLEAPVNPGIYHIVFFEKLLTFLQSFRKKIEESHVWLQESNKRSQKKNYWSMYKKKGSSFLLAPDHYLQRSAG